VDGDGSTIEEAIGELDRLVVNAPKVPLVDHIRIDAPALREAVERLHAATRREGAGFDDGFDRALDELEVVVAEAKEIPLTDDVRCDRRRIEAAIDLLRARVPPASEQDGWGWKE